MYEKACGLNIKYEIIGRREGDIGKLVAKVAKANEILEWKTVKNNLEMCEDAYNFIRKNPEGIV